MDPQFRTVLDADTRTVDDGTSREVEALVLPYTNEPDTYRTTWAPGWADDSLRAVEEGRATIPVVFGHDERNIANIVGSVVASTPTDRGARLRMRFANFDDVPSARACHSLLRDGHISGWSFKFRDGETVPDANHRGALKFTRAKLVHVSPVIDPSVPGTHTISVRDTDGNTVNAPDVSTAGDALASALHAAVTAGHRSVTITIGDDGAITTTGDNVADDGASSTTTDADDPEPTPNELAAAIDGAVDSALLLAAQLDLASLPQEVGAMVQLLHAADVAVDELLEVLGLPDPDPFEGIDDETVTAAREAAAEISAERAPKEPYGDVDYADPGYQKDKKKRYPIDTADHVHAAWAYINKEHNAGIYSTDDLAKIKDRIKTAAKKLGVTIADSATGSRTADDDLGLDVRVALATRLR